MTAIFPPQAYQGYLYVDTSALKVFYPFRYLYTELSDIKKAAYQTITTVESYDIAPIAVVFPIKFDRFYEIPQTTGQVAYNDFDRMRSFLQPLRLPGLFEVVAARVQLHQKDTLYSVACFPISLDNKSVDGFFQSTLQDLDPLETEAAIYRFGEPFSWDLNTGERGVVKTDVPTAVN